MPTRLAAACCAAALLSGCQTTEVPNVSPIVGTVIGIVPEQVQNYAVQACGYLPTAQTVADLAALWTGVQVPDIARQIAAEICAAVLAPKPETRRAGRTIITVRGVRITGAFVR